MKLLTASSPRELETFIRMPFRLYHDDTRWIPPLVSSELRMMNPKVNPFYRHSEAAHFMVERDGKLIGRISAIDNRLHNETQKEKTGFWGYFECENDPEVATLLFDTAADWLRKRGLTRMLGPANPSLNDPCGLLVDGFEWSPFVLMTYNPRYYPTLVTKAGFTKAMDLLAYIIPHQELDRARVDRIADIIRKRTKATIRCVDMSKLESELKIINEIYNDAWQSNWGFCPMTEEEIRFTAEDLQSILLPEFAFIAEVAGKPVGFAFALPDINRSLKKCNGSLLPFGWWHFLKFNLRKIPVMRIVALGVRKDHHTSGLGTLLYQKFFIDGLARGYTAAECSWILETNTLMNSPILQMGGKPYKRYRLYERPL
ncbi:MAG TPA: GNAT family N-acetyltransferase [Planctomycetota bacterium]|nr:GNAT family N-acetyltransferase [Planctomycetota bacterium]